MKFYSYIERVGNSLLYRYVEKGERKISVIDKFPINLYVKSPNGQHNGIYGTKLNKEVFMSMEHADKFISSVSDSIDIHGMDDFVLQFISNEYQDDIEFDISQLNIAVLDIECRSNDGFPKPSLANQEITAITLKLLNKDEFYTFGCGEYKYVENHIYVKCDNEKQLLNSFLKVWSHLSPDIVTGYNISGFDIPYLVNRIKNVLTYGHTKLLSPFKDSIRAPIKQISLFNGDESYKIFGVVTFDYIELYKKFSSKKLERYTLDNVSYVELGEKKVSYKEEYGTIDNLFLKNYELFLDYNIQDVKLIEKLDNKLNFIYLSLVLVYLGKIRHVDIFGQIKFWDSYIYNSLRKEGIQVPPREKITRERIEGAYVKKPTPGLYDWVVSMDLTSLYPSILMQWNLSPETILERTNRNIVESILRGDVYTDALIQNDACMTANGSLFKNSKEGILPRLTREMFESRKKYKELTLQTRNEIEKCKKEGKSIEELSFRESSYDALQMAFKISLNSLYGATSHEAFRYFSREISEGITLTGQAIIRYITKEVNIFLNEQLSTNNEEYVIYADTDSAFIRLDGLIKRVQKGNETKEQLISFIDRFAKKILTPFIDNKFNHFSKMLNTNECLLKMKRESICDKGLWRAKKNYILQVYDNEGVRYKEPKLKAVGIEITRSSTPEICRNALKKAINIILNGTNEELINFIQSFKKQFMSASLSDIAFPRGVSDMDKFYSLGYTDSLTFKNEDEEEGLDWQTGTPIHVKSSISYNNLINELGLGKQIPMIKNGDKIKFVYLKTPNKTLNNAISFIDDLPTEFGLEDLIDKETQFSKSFMKPITSFTEILKWTTEATNTLFDIDAPITKQKKKVNRKNTNEYNQHNTNTLF